MRRPGALDGSTLFFFLVYDVLECFDYFNWVKGKKKQNRAGSSFWLVM